MIVEEPIRYQKHGFPLGDPCGLTRRWNKILRADGCTYCGGMAGTVDHIEPKRGRRASLRDNNLTGACQSCNEAKADLPLLFYLLDRVNSGERGEGVDAKR